MEENTRFVVHKRKFFDGIVDFVSFSHEVRHLVEILNTEIEAPEKVVFRPISHPAGFVRLISKRRLTIAEAYIKLLSLSQNADYMGRIEALQVLVHHVWHSKNLSMPINTARVQIALMKNAVKLRGNRRAQLELMSDFARASYGQTSVIRRLLRELDLIEVPETGADLSQMRLGWDDHVHDSMTEGRKSPSQLVLDAFIKGISRITVAYYDVAERQTYEEIFMAGRILGIRVQIGIEFSVGRKCERVHYLYVPPQDWEYEALSHFLDINEARLAPFWRGLKENAERRHATVVELLSRFNRTGLLQFNESYGDLSVLQMEALSWESVERVTSKGQANRIHLGQVIYQSMRPVALKRVLYLKNQYRTILERASRDASSSWEAERCFKRYEEALRAYEELTPSLCAEKYIAPQKQVDYDSSFLTESDILPLLSECGGYIVFIHPLSHGLQRGIDILFDTYRYITDVEVFNLVDALTRDTVEIRRFASLLSALQEGTSEAVEKMMKEWRLVPKPQERISAVMEFLRERSLYMRCASDAVGWSSNIPGMGFIHESSLSSRTLRQIRRSGHAMLPEPVTHLLQSQSGRAGESGKSVYLMSSTRFHPDAFPASAGKIHPMNLWRLWRYLNIHLRSFIMLLTGFLPAFLTFYYTLGVYGGLGYAALWFLLTGFRNSIVDMIASAGLFPGAWQLKSIDRENLSASLFFTGFSVPILALAKYGFDEVWHFYGLSEGFLFTFVKFWVIAFTNGLYLAAHNTLRGFDRAAVRGNFFRSVLSWPLATAGSYVLTPLGVPDVVQSKISSEIVAGIIEGTVKNFKQKRLARKAVLDVCHQLTSSNTLCSMIARLDFLFFWSCYTQARRYLQRLFCGMPGAGERGVSGESLEEIERARTILVDAFTTEGSLELLTYVILEYCPEENLTILTDFVGETHGPFVEWLNRKCVPYMEKRG